ncbi:PREDICTED: MLP-like protein 43 isoform X3 [Lupinus angustifolius]|uniref:MLP-like protein 43 isoform X3 n=1 Tax=Lupinus angustifolius TaxID=3871 RepID=UPI00092F8CCB|nr:PREDICTED: MLP-like protein 43 isoform X3 [Lupinus angustifolius]
MSLTGKITTEFGILSPATKFFHFVAKQLHHVQNVSDKVHHTKVHEGDWHSVGSVRNWTYVVDGKVTRAKEKFEVIDEEKKTLVMKIFDGDVSNQYKLFKVTLQLNDTKDNDGAIIKWTIDYEKLNREIAPPYGHLRYLYKITEDIDAHLLKA